MIPSSLILIPDDLHVLQRFAINHLASLGSEYLIRSQVVLLQNLQNLALSEDFREESSTWNLLPLTFIPSLIAQHRWCKIYFGRLILLNEARK